MISAVVITKNEEEKIPVCLESLSWCSEIIVIDDASEDKTRQLARKLGATVYERSLGADFSAQRNFGLAKAHNDWVLFVDVDEQVTRELASEIKLVLKGDMDGYLIKRSDIFMGKRMTGGEWGANWLLRLGKKSKGKWVRRVHEKWEINGKVGKLASPLLHSPTPSLRKFITKLNYYSTFHAKSNLEEGKRVSLVKIIFIPPAKFIDNFVLRGGYGDGIYGFVYAILMSFHSFLAWSKLWIELQKAK